MNLGPIQLIAFAFDSVNNFEGQIRRELDELRGRGLIRVIDLLFIIRRTTGWRPVQPCRRTSGI